MLEARLYQDNAFLTLTYDEKSLPADGSLRIKDAQDFIKRLRERLRPNKIRTFYVGEYGDTTFRPHYHLAVFNFPSCVYGTSRFSQTVGTFTTRRSSCCTSCDLVLSTWGHGLVSLGVLNEATAAYISGYILKKMTHRLDPRLEGREPEFARMSLKPGIGRDAMKPVADALRRYDLDATLPDVPTALRHGPQLRPLGRYLRRSLRSDIGREKDAPIVSQLAHSLSMQTVLKNSIRTKKSLAAQIVDENKTATDTLLARHKLFSTKRGKI